MVNQAFRHHDDGLRHISDIAASSDATMRFMRRGDSFLSAPAKHLLTALSIVGLSLSGPLALGSSPIHEKVVEAGGVSDHLAVGMATSKRTAFMEISRPKRIKADNAKAFAQSSGASDSLSDAKKAVGCYVNNVWYPEGAIYPPQERGTITATVVTYICRGGKWIIRRKGD